MVQRLMFCDQKSYWTVRTSDDGPHGLELFLATCR
jgi:hypothetical protein